MSRRCHLESMWRSGRAPQVTAGHRQCSILARSRAATGLWAEFRRRSVPVVSHLRDTKSFGSSIATVTVRSKLTSSCGCVHADFSAFMYVLIRLLISSKFSLESGSEISLSIHANPSPVLLRKCIDNRYTACEYPRLQGDPLDSTPFTRDALFRSCDQTWNPVRVQW